MLAISFVATREEAPAIDRERREEAENISFDKGERANGIYGRKR